MSSPARWASLAAGLLLLVGPLAAQLPEAKFSTIPEQDSKGELKGVVANLSVRPNTEAGFYLYLTNKGDSAWDNLRVLITADETLNQVLYVGEVARLEKSGQVGSNAYVALQSVKKTAPAATVAPAAPGAEPVKPVPPLAPKKVYIHVRKLENNKLDVLGVDQKPSPVELRLQNPTSYIKVTEPRVNYDKSTNSYSLKLTVNDRAKKDSGFEPFKGPPAKVRLDLRPELIPGLDVDSIRDGTLETVVEPNQEGYVLSVSKLKINGSPKPSILAVSVDGFERAFVFRTNFGTSDTPEDTTPAVVANPLTRIDLPKYSMPGKPLTAKLEVFGDPSDTNPNIVPELTFQRTLDGKAELLSIGMTSPRNIRLGAQVGEAGELQLSSIVKDWEVPVNTRGVFGKRSLNFTLKGANPDPNEAEWPLQLKSTANIVLDHTPPESTPGKEVSLKVLPIVYPKPPEPKDEDDDECSKKEKEREEKKELLAKLKKEGCEPPPGAILQLPGKDGDAQLTPEQKAAKEKAKAEEERQLSIPGDFPEKIRVDTKIRLVAEGFDRESEIEKVYFFIGPPPGSDNKSNKETKVLEGVPFLPKGSTAPGATAIGGLYTVEIETPAKPDTMSVGVRFINKAGLVSEVVKDFKVVEPPPPPKPKEKPTTGTIKGKVTQGDRPQRGLPVKLYNGKAEVVLETETDENGDFQFCKVPPGSYRVHAVKATDKGASDTKSVVLKAGKTEQTELNLLRRAAN